MSLTIEDYSERAVALFGNTKPYKNTINELGGKFNSSLKVPNSDDRRAGWIFPKSKRAVVQKLIQDIESGEIEAEAVEEKKYEEKKYEKKDYNKTSTSIEVSRTDFLNLLAKVERLEQEVNNLKLQLSGKKTSSSSSSKILKEEVNEEEEGNSDVEEDKPKKGLLRRNKKD